MQQGEKIGFSHFGEDQIVSFFLGDGKTSGFYVDVGCYHPTLFSNTYLFYQRGWRGVLVDANPFMIDLCREIRPDDISLNLAIGDHDGTATLYKFNHWGSSNTIDTHFRDHLIQTQKVEVTETVDVEMLSLESLFSKFSQGRDIDFLNIDIENADYKALIGNNWDKYRPKIIAVEDLNFDNGNPSRSKTHNFLIEKDYNLESRAVFTSIYVAKEVRQSLNPEWRTF